MELFAIERYVGDSSSTVQSSAKESQKLAEILEEAKGRKRMREISKLHTVKGAGQSNNEASLQGMKKKKKKGSKVKKGRKLKHERKEDESSGCLESICREDEDLEESRCVLDNSAYAEIKNPVKRLRTLNGQDGCDEDTQSATKHSKVNDKMTIIGGQATKQGPISVQRILPKWLANPYFFSNDVQHSLLPTSRLEYLDREFVKKLLKQNIRNFFPVQQVIIAEILSCWEEKSPYGRGGFLPPDICVCAPTGSGKTLAYVLPIVQLLQISMIRRVEALVIVPSKDLATQVWRIFNLYVQGTHLKVGLANGLKTLQREQEQLGRKSAIGYLSHVNILVATPGRLVEHISSTEGFTLQFIRFFVIDEADRLLAEPYYGWLNKVYNSVFSSSNHNKEGYRTAFTNVRFPPNLLTPFWSAKIQRPLQKLLFSATLTQNPEKLAPLQLYRPKFFTVSKPTATIAEGMEENEKYAEEWAFSVSQTPSTLEESMYICNTGGKPLVLLYLLIKLGFERVLCFTSSVESTHRLHLLIKHFGGVVEAEFSSNLSAVQRQAILQDFNNGKIQLIICSDAMARGLDLQDVQYVVSYDPPVSSKTYIHRVGRTARAGKTGTAISLLHGNEVFHFKKLLKSLGKSKIAKHSVKDSILQPLMGRYEEALEKLKTEVTSDKKQKRRVRDRASRSFE